MLKSGRQSILPMLAMLLASCGIMDDPGRDTIIQEKTGEVKAFANVFGASLQTNVREVDRPWHGSTLPEDSTKKPFPPLLSKPDSVLLQSADVVTLSELASVMEQATGQPVHLIPKQLIKVS